MTNEELKNMPSIIDTLLDDAITDSTRQKVKDNLTEVCKLAIKALEAQPSEDAVSRSELMKLYKEWQPRLATNVCEFEQALEDLPSVTPERPKGKWIWDLRMGLHKCSVCSKFCDFDYLYCPNCGAEMGGVK